MRNLFRKFATDTAGTSAVEHGALVMFVGLAIVLALEGIGLPLEEIFTGLKSVFASGSPNSGG